MHLILFIVIAVSLLLPLSLRGKAIHNYMVYEAESIFRQAGFNTWLEYGIHLLDGKLIFVDLMAQRGSYIFCVEIETSARHILDTAAKVDTFGLPLWVIVPNRKVKRAIIRKLEKHPYRPGGLTIYFLLLDELKQAVMNYFPLFSPAYATRENRKINKEDEKHENPLA